MSFLSRESEPSIRKTVVRCSSPQTPRRPSPSLPPGRTLIVHVVIQRSASFFHCDLFSSALVSCAGVLAAISALRLLMAVSTCHIARSNSTSSWGRSRACVILLPLACDSSILSPFVFCALVSDIESELSLSSSRESVVASGVDGSGCFCWAYTSSTTGEGVRARSLFLRRNCTCFPPDKARQCDQAR